MVEGVVASVSNAIDSDITREIVAKVTGAIDATELVTLPKIVRPKMGVSLHVTPAVRLVTLQENVLRPGTRPT